MQNESSSVDPQLIPEIASKAHVDVAMLDTAVKDGKTLFNFLTEKATQRICRFHAQAWFGSRLGWFFA